MSIHRPACTNPAPHAVRAAIRALTEPTLPPAPHGAGTRIDVQTFGDMLALDRIVQISGALDAVGEAYDQVAQKLDEDWQVCIPSARGLNA